MLHLIVTVRNKSSYQLYVKPAYNLYAVVCIACFYFRFSFFHRVAACASQNLMDVDNLAVVITPNIIPSRASSAVPDALTFQTSVVRCLIDKALQLGRVSMLRSNEALKLPAPMGSCRRKQPIRRTKLKPWSSLDCLDDCNDKDVSGKRPGGNRVTSEYSTRCRDTSTCKTCIHFIS